MLQNYIAEAEPAKSNVIGCIDHRAAGEFRVPGAALGIAFATRAAVDMNAFAYFKRLKEAESGLQSKYFQSVDAFEDGRPSNGHNKRDYYNNIGHIGRVAIGFLKKERDPRYSTYMHSGCKAEVHAREIATTAKNRPFEVIEVAQFINPDIEPVVLNKARIAISGLKHSQSFQSTADQLKLSPFVSEVDLVDNGKPSNGAIVISQPNLRFESLRANEEGEPWHVISSARFSDIGKVLEKYLPFTHRDFDAAMTTLSAATYLVLKDNLQGQFDLIRDTDI